MSVHPLAEGFASVADRYERGRPDYSPAIVGAVMAELGLAPGAAVLDLAAGTGKLSRALFAAGLDVIAVEPQAELRDLLMVHIEEDRVHEGLAEAIPLDDGSVEAVTVADAFHWFDQEAALSEIGRVLRPGGGLAVLATIPDWSEASWAHELESLITELRPGHPAMKGPQWRDAVRASGRWTEPREVRVTVSQSTSPGRVVDHVTSISWIAALPPERMANTVERMRAIVEAGETPAELPLQVQIGLTELA